MNTIKKHKGLALAAALVLVTLISAFFLVPVVSSVAVAGQTQPKSVSVQAQIETDGSLSVTDQRTFSAEQKKARLSWQISATTSMSATTIAGVRVIVDTGGEPQIITLDAAQVAQSEFSAEDLPENAWAFDAEYNWFHVALSPELASKNVVMEVSYVQKNAVFVYDDVAELYWEYLPILHVSPATATLDTTEITCQVLIPSSATNEIINHKTVWGWGHGFAGSVEFSEAGAYIYKSEAHTLNKTSQAHIIFPSTCLVNYNKNSATNVGGARQGKAISEEAKWTDEWSVQTANSALVSAWACVVAFCVTLMAAIAYAGVYRKYKRILGDNVSLNEQLAFDKKCLTFQKRMLVLSFTLLLISLFCLISLNSFVGFGAFLLSFITCLLQCNYVPSVHSSFRDSIKG